MNRPGAAVSADALRAAAMCAIEPRLGGLVLSAREDAEGALVSALAAALPAGVRVRRLPLNPRDDQLESGVDLAAALAGRAGVRQPGLLDGGGLLVVPAADRLTPSVAARISAAVDEGLVVIALVDEDQLWAGLSDRLAFRPRSGGGGEGQADPGDPVTVPQAVEVLTEAAMAFGVASSRADLLALRAARAAATLDGRDALSERDLMEAIRLVLAPRATRLPSPDQVSSDAPPLPPGGGEGEDGAGELADRVIAAAEAAIDPALLSAIAAGAGRRGEGRLTRGPGERRRARLRGRPIGTRAGDPRNGGQLALVETLRAALPWQRLRGRIDRVLVRKDDLRIYRREARSETAVVFAVDASGSAAVARLAEAKGAVELLLGQAYVQRAEVAVVAFRGTGAELLLPPTRSLTRARRALADLPGGGGTPLADGIGSALGVATAVRARGRTPMLVVVSDGRANLAAGGIAAGRAAAENDALAAARGVRTEGIAAVFVDIGARPRPEGARIADAMGARYVPLPFAGAGGLKAVVQALAPTAS